MNMDYERQPIRSKNRKMLVSEGILTERAGKDYIIEEDGKEFLVSTNREEANKICIANHSDYEYFWLGQALRATQNFGELEWKADNDARQAKILEKQQESAARVQQLLHDLTPAKPLSLVDAVMLWNSLMYEERRILQVYYKEPDGRIGAFSESCHSQDPPRHPTKRQRQLCADAIKRRRDWTKGRGMVVPVVHSSQTVCVCAEGLLKENSGQWRNERGVFQTVHHYESQDSDGYITIAFAATTKKPGQKLLVKHIDILERNMGKAKHAEMSADMKIRGCLIWDGRKIIGFTKAEKVWACRQPSDEPFFSCVCCV
jgi:hypothetical protein